MRISRTKILPGLIVMWVLAFVVYYGMPPLEDMLMQGEHWLFDYLTWQNGAVDNWGYRILWAIGDLSEGTVHKALFASVGVVLGGWIAHVLWKKGSSKMGCPVCANTGLFPWIVLSAFVGLFVSSALYAGNLSVGWVPTFLPGCTIPPALVLMYGKGPKVAISAGVLCGIIQFPLGNWGTNMATALGWPGIAGDAVVGMCVAGILIMLIFPLLPWIAPLEKERRAAQAAQAAAAAAAPKSASDEPAPLPPTVSDKPFWLVRRSLADFTEIYFYGNEIAGVCLIAGMLLSWVLNPAHTGYGGPYFTSAILAAQFMGSSLAIFLYFGCWQKYGFYNTFTASLAQGAMVLTFGTDLKVLLIGAVLNAVIVPFCAFKASSLVPKRFHSVVGGTCGMGIGIGIVGLIMKAILAVL